MNKYKNIQMGSLITLILALASDLSFAGGVEIPRCVDSKFPNPAYEACVAATKCAIQAVDGSVCSARTPAICGRGATGESLFKQLKGGNICGAIAANTDGATAALLSNLIQSCIGGDSTPPEPARSQFCQSLHGIPERECSSIPKTIKGCI